MPAGSRLRLHHLSSGQQNFLIILFLFSFRCSHLCVRFFCLLWWWPEAPCNSVDVAQTRKPTHNPRNVRMIPPTAPPYLLRSTESLDNVFLFPLRYSPARVRFPVPGCDGGRSFPAKANRTVRNHEGALVCSARRPTESSPVQSRSGSASRRSCGPQ
jgi:hypothetical protein